MLLVGVTGGIGSGKTTVAKIMGELEPLSSMPTSSLAMPWSSEREATWRSLSSSGPTFCFPVVR